MTFKSVHLSQFADQEQHDQHDNECVKHGKSPFVYADLRDPQQPQYDEDERNHEQCVHEIACAGEARVDARPRISKQPQYEQNYNDPGKHEVSPYSGDVLLTYPTTNIPEPHPTTGECLSPPLGGESQIYDFLLSTFKPPDD
jgi:hypothetical protein